MSTSELDGRGTRLNPANRYERLHVEQAPDDDAPPDAAPVPTELYRDASRSILAENDSPDIGFRFSLNPYRGCEHGCVYCYARPSHEYLGFSAGLDFERKLMVKMDAPELLRAALAAPRWEPQVVALSGNTDCYQPVERQLRLTRACLEVFAEFRNPVSLITKSALVTRDADVLATLAADGAVQVNVTVTLVLSATPLAPAVGLLDTMVGAVVSARGAVVKLDVNCAASGLPAASFAAVVTTTV